jgi:hypothetical protein
MGQNGNYLPEQMFCYNPPLMIHIWATPSREGSHSNYLSGRLEFSLRSFLLRWFNRTARHSCLYVVALDEDML